MYTKLFTEEFLAEKRKEWLNIGLSTEPLDFDTAKEEAIKAYKIAGLTAPHFFYKFESPLSAAYAAAILKNMDQVRDQVWDQVGDQVGDQVRDQVWDQVGDQVRDQVWDQVWAQVFGCHDANWLGFYDCFAGIVSDVERLRPLMNLAKYCGWFSPYKTTVIFQDRPSLIKFDEQRRLHCENGPSIKYRDGFSVYSWHGVRVKKEWIEDKSLTPKEALSQTNVELRRAACEIIGWDKVLEDPSLHPKTIDEDLPHIGRLIEVDLPDAKKQWFLKYQCGTGRWFAESVNDKSFNTALKANAGGNGWRGQGDPESFIPFIRT